MMFAHMLECSVVDRIVCEGQAISEMRAQMGYKSYLMDNDMWTNRESGCPKNYQEARDKAIALGADVSGFSKTLWDKAFPKPDRGVA